MLLAVYKQQVFIFFHGFTDWEVKNKTRADLMSGEGLLCVSEVTLSVFFHGKKG